MDSNSTLEEVAKKVTASYIVRLAGCGSCLETVLALCANDHGGGYKTKHMMARRAIVSSEHALLGVLNTHNAVWSRGGDFTATVEYEGQPAMTCLGHLDLTLELLRTAEEELVEYLDNPTATADDRPMIERVLVWVRYCLWDLSQLRDSPKPAVRRAS